MFMFVMGLLAYALGIAGLTIWLMAETQYLIPFIIEMFALVMGALSIWWGLEYLVRSVADKEEHVL